MNFVENSFNRPQTTSLVELSIAIKKLWNFFLDTPLKGWRCLTYDITGNQQQQQYLYYYYHIIVPRVDSRMRALILPYYTKNSDRFECKINSISKAYY